MNDKNLPQAKKSTTAKSKLNGRYWLHRGRLKVGRSLIRKFIVVLDKISDGQLDIIWPDSQRTQHGSGGSPITLTLYNYQPVKKLLFEGSNGFAESYIFGDWDVDDIDAFFMLIMRNEQALFSHFGGSWFARARNTLAHALKVNSKTGSKRNIMYHYDLGNSFYREWLDESMVYSSGVFASPQQTLAQAQRNKMAKVIDLLELESGHSVLEIGCGWGALSHAIANSANCSVDAVSLSQEQLSYARLTHSVDERVNYLFQDYREINGIYDRIVSIEMFEAVGQQYWARYFDRLSTLLRSGGTAVLQVITIAEDRFESYRKSPDFIQRYIFPGGMLPTRTQLAELISGAGFELVDDKWFGQDYALTLSRWRSAFEGKLPQVKALGYDDKFIRLWRYYLAYCEVGFTLGETNVGMLKLARR